MRTLLLRASVTMLVLYNVMLSNSPTLYTVLILARMGFVCKIIINNNMVTDLKDVLKMINEDIMH